MEIAGHLIRPLTPATPMSGMFMFTVRNEAAKVMFSQACVCLRGGGVPGPGGLVLGGCMLPGGFLVGGCMLLGGGVCSCGGDVCS